MLLSGYVQIRTRFLASLSAIRGLLCAYLEAIAHQLMNQSWRQQRQRRQQQLQPQQRHRRRLQRQQPHPRQWQRLRVVANSSHQGLPHSMFVSSTRFWSSRQFWHNGHASARHRAELDTVRIDISCQFAGLFKIHSADIGRPISVIVV